MVDYKYWTICVGIRQLRTQTHRFQHVWQ